MFGLTLLASVLEESIHHLPKLLWKKPRKRGVIKSFSPRYHRSRPFSTCTTSRWIFYLVLTVFANADCFSSQAIAKHTLSDKAWAYYSSASDDEITNRENHAAYHRFVSLRLRCLGFSHSCLAVGSGSVRAYCVMLLVLIGLQPFWGTSRPCQFTW